MTDQKRGWIYQTLISIITSLVVLAGGYFTLQGTVITSENSAEASKLETAFRRIEYLETQMAEQQATSNSKIVQLTSEVFRLRSELNKNLNILDMFERFMNGLPFEAWVKEVEYIDGKPVFKMVAINKQYEFTRGISRIRYEGATDAEIWGTAIADKFYATDLKVLEMKSSLIIYEEFPKTAQARIRGDDSETKMVVKIYLELIDGREMVFGMALDVPNGQQ